MSSATSMVTSHSEGTPMRTSVLGPRSSMAGGIESWKTPALVADLASPTPAVARAALVGKVSDGTACAGRVRVTAGDAQNSLLVRKLRRATVDCGGFMPMDGEPIDDAALQRIVAWIDGGACNN